MEAKRVNKSDFRDKGLKPGYIPRFDETEFFQWLLDGVNCRGRCTGRTREDVTQYLKDVGSANAKLDESKWQKIAELARRVIDTYK